MIDKTEAELREMAENFELQKAQLENVMRQEDLLRMSLEEHLRAKETMVRVKECRDDSEVLIPIGANIFLSGKLGDKNKVVVGIGSETAMEGSIDEALERLEERTKRLSDAKEKLSKGREELNNKVVELEMQKGKGSG
jgi:prefoldin alpha subunit